MGIEKDKDMLSVDKITAQLTLDAKQNQQNAYTCLSHEQLLARLIEQVEKVDFRSLAGFEPDDEDSRLKRQHYLIIVVEQILVLAERNRWYICRRNNFFYTYNGAFWRLIDKDELKRFLRQVAEKMGVDRFTAHYVEFSKDLFDQFNELAYFPEPEVDYETVKINLMNGTFEVGIKNQELLPPNASDFLTYQLPFAYDSEAKAPLFEAFLNRVQPDEDCQKVLAEYLGYIFIKPSKLKLEKALLLYGSGANGKSVFFEIITALLGSENVSHYSLQSLTNEPAYCRAHLATKLVNYASEISGRLEADSFKQMVSGEPIQARLPYGQPFILTNYAKLIFNCNELPTDVEYTNAFFRRFLIIPFPVTIPEEEQDKHLADKIIKQELSGVFNWALSGLKRLLEQGSLTDCEAARQQLKAYKKQSDSVQLFLDEYEYKNSTEHHTPLKDLYRDYKVYCIEDGYRPVNNRNFRKRLENNDIQIVKRNIGQVVYIVRSGEY